MVFSAISSVCIYHIVTQSKRLLTAEEICALGEDDRYRRCSEWIITRSNIFLDHRDYQLHDDTHLSKRELQVLNAVKSQAEANYWRWFVSRRRDIVLYCEYCLWGTNATLDNVVFQYLYVPNNATLSEFTNELQSALAEVHAKGYIESKPFIDTH